MLQANIHTFTHILKIFFLKEVMLHIRLKRMEHRASCKYIFCPYIHSTTNGVEGKRKFLKVAMLHIKLKVMELRVHVLCKHIFCLYKHAQHVGWLMWSSCRLNSKEKQT